MITNKKQHTIALITLSLTAIVWGAGFLLSDLLLKNGFSSAPMTLNALRFGIAAIVLVAVFFRKFKLTKNLLLFGGVGGLLLFGGFSMQLLGLKYTTPASCGFFTASYVLFVPFISWIFCKKRPTIWAWIGIALACAGLVLMNIPLQNQVRGSNPFLGNMLTLCGALFFAVQIVLTDYVLKSQRVDAGGMTVVQVVTCAILFVVVALSFEAVHYSTMEIQWEKCWYALAIVSLLGTAFAYLSQTYAQTNLSPTATSIIIACESPIGAFLSMTLGIEPFAWNLCVGGLLIISAIVFVEILPDILSKKATHTAPISDTDSAAPPQEQPKEEPENNGQTKTD